MTPRRGPQGALLEQPEPMSRSSRKWTWRHRRGSEVWLETVRILREQVEDELLIRGNCDQASYSLAALMRGPEALDDGPARP